MVRVYIFILMAVILISMTPTQFIKLPEHTYFITFYGQNCQTCIPKAIKQIKYLDSASKIVVVAPGLKGGDFAYFRRYYTDYQYYDKHIQYINNLDTFEQLTNGLDISHIVYMDKDTILRQPCFADLYDMVQWAKSNR
jgi:hypothetical protein